MFVTPALIVGFYVFGFNAEHFGWGFFPFLATIAILQGLAVLSALDAAFAAIAWVVAARRGLPERIARHRHVLVFDLVQFAYLSVGFLGLFLTDRMGR